MAVKRVTDSYAKGIQAFASARRPPQSQVARAASSQPSPTLPVRKPRVPPPQVPAALNEAVDTAIADIAADIAKAHQQTKPAAEPPVPTDYHDIIAKTIATLDNSTVEARHAVYECARQVVYQRLGRSRPALSPDAFDQERQSLDRAIEKIEEFAARDAPPGPAPENPAIETVTPPPRAIAPVIITTPRRDLPQVSHFRGGIMRLFGMTALVCAGIFGYWLWSGKPDFRSATVRVPRDTPAATEETTASDADNTKQALASPPSPQPTSAVADRTPKMTQSSADQRTTPSPLSGSAVACVGGICDGTAANPLNAAQFTNPRAEAAPQSWLTTYGKVSPKPTRAPSAKNAATTAAPAGNFERGLEQAKGGDPELAIRYFTDAIRANPNFSDGYLQRGNMRFKNGNPELAIADFNEAIRTDARNAAAFKARGMALLYKGDEDAALEDLTRAIQIAEADGTRLTALELFFARRSRAAMYVRKQNDERELFDLGAMIDAYWKNPDLADALKANYGMQGAAAVMASIYRQRAALYQQRANIDGAVADLSLALQLDPAHMLPILAERARLQEAAGRREQALADFRRALELNPRYEEARQALVRLKN